MKGRILNHASRLSTILLIVTLAFTAFADTGANHRGVSSLFGTSGGNVRDISTLYCCSGTLGSLVQDDLGAKYILSNNHVLARSDSGVAGDDISQPGLVDNACRVPTVVAYLSAFPSLATSNVDAAIALSRGIMSSDGVIMDIGTISSVPLTPAVNMVLQKSGRTTGRTTGPVSSVNTNVTVQYQPTCGVGKKFRATFRNQVVVNSSTFSAGGDSGSLMLSVPSGGGSPQPVALLYAGSSTTTIGNPIGEVLRMVGQSLGRPVTFVGSSTISAPTMMPSGGQGSKPSPKSFQRAHGAKEHWVDAFMSRPGVIGVGVGLNDDGSDAAVVVYVEHGSARPNLPDRAEGAPLRIVFTDSFVSR